MFCTNCGNNTQESDRFCTKCGSPADTAKKAIKKEVAKEAKLNQKKEEWTAGRIAKYAIGIIVVGGLVLFSLGSRVINTLESDALEANDSALAAMDAGDNSAAAQQLLNAAESATLDSNKLIIYTNLGYVYATDVEYVKALTAFKKALTYTSVGTFDYHLISGEIALIEGDTASAISNYNLAYAKKPNDFQINNALMLFYLDLEDTHPQYYDPARAISFGEVAYKNTDASFKTAPAQNLGIAYYLNEDYSQALKYLKLANQNDPYTLYFLALAYFGKGDEATAKLYFQRALNAGVPLEQEFIDYFGL